MMIVSLPIILLLLRRTNHVHAFSLSATTTNAAKVPEEDRRGPISMGVEELADKIGGIGRARVVWDYYSIGIDPALFFDPEKVQEESIETILPLLPSQRRSQPLGKDALERLASLYDNPAGRLEGGVASLSHVSQSKDKTTKLLLRLADGLEVETVIIPWNNTRSTLCMSSQVGCRQGMCVRLYFCEMK